MRKADNTLSERDHVLHVGFGNFLTHAVLGSINDALGHTLVILHKRSDIVQVVIGQGALVLHKQSELGIALVVGHDLNKFGEMP